jgi:hypothetical protein
MIGHLPTCVQVSGCKPCLELDLVAVHMAQYGWVIPLATDLVGLSTSPCRFPLMPFCRASSTSTTGEATSWSPPSSSNISTRRHCIRCGHKGHVSQFRMAVTRPSGAPAFLWSTMVLRVGPPASVPAGVAPIVAGTTIVDPVDACL